MTKVHRLDAVGLSNTISSALKLGCTLPLQQRQQQQQQQEGSGGEGYIYAELLSSATKQVAHANAHAAGMLLAALTNLQQQQQQLGALQQQLDLWGSFAAALSGRLQACAAVQQLSREDASKLCSTVGRLSGLLVRQRTAAAAAVAAAADIFQQQQQTSAADAAVDVLQDFDSDLSDDPSFDTELPAEMQPVTGDTAVSPLACVTCHPQDSSVTTIEQLQQLQQHYTQLQQQLRALLSLAAQQVEQQAPFGGAAAPAAAGGSLADVSRVLYALAKTWAWPGWPAVLGLLQQYSTGVQSAQLFAAAAAAAEAQEGRGGKRGSKSRRQQQQQQMSGFSPGMLSQPGLGFTGRTGSRVYGDSVVKDETTEVLTAVRESLPPAIWAVGRLAEQQLQQLQRQRCQQQQLLLQELQQHQQLWRTVGPVLAVVQQQLGWLGPLQLAQVAAGLGKLVYSSRSLVQLAGSHAHAHLPGTRPPGAGMDASSSGPSGTGQMDVTAAAAGGVGAGEAEKAAHVLDELLAGPELRRVLQQHVSRVESLLPLLALQHRVQLAVAYDQLGLQLPRSVAAVFERDAAQQQT
jgi:hypothetical protein